MQQGRHDLRHDRPAQRARLRHRHRRPTERLSTARDPRRGTIAPGDRLGRPRRSARCVSAGQSRRGRRCAGSRRRSRRTAAAAGRGPCPSTSSSSAPGIAAAVARPPETWTIRSASPWITRAGTVSARSRGAAVGLGQDREHLPHHPVGAEPAVPRLLGPAEDLVVVLRVGRGADHAATAAPRSRRTPPGPARAARSASGSSLGCCQPTVRLPMRGHDAGQRQDPLRALDRPSSARSSRPSTRPTRWARRRCPRWSSSPKASAAMSDSVYGGGAAAPGERPAPAAAADPATDLGRPPGVAVVVADDEEPALRPAAVQNVRVPPDHRSAETHHQQQRVAVRVAEGLVAELDPGPTGAKSSSETARTGLGSVRDAMGPVNRAPATDRRRMWRFAQLSRSPGS